jgi:hypothetical protein
MARIEAYAWNDTDSVREIKIQQFDDVEKARLWLRHAKTTNKILATTPEDIGKARELLWGGK